MPGRVPAAVSLCFVLAAQVRKLSRSVSLGWADGAHKRHARNSDSDAAIIEVLSYPLCFRSLPLVVVAWPVELVEKLCLRPPLFFWRATAGVRCTMICSRERRCCPGRHSLKSTFYRLGGDRSIMPTQLRIASGTLAQ